MARTEHEVVMVDRGPLTWAPVSLSTDRVIFDTSCLGTETEHPDVWTVIHTDSVTRIEREGTSRGHHLPGPVPPVGSRVHLSEDPN